MKPPAFVYDRPTSLPQALALLAEHGDEAKLLAGGQSLVPLMNFRLARPERLVDINRIPELTYVHEENGQLTVGAMTRQRTIERSGSNGWPLLSEAIGHIGHVQIRNRGTIGGSLAHADPSAELPAVMLALDAELVVLRGGGQRRIAATDFFLSAYSTALEQNEMLTEIRLPATAPRTGMAFEEMSRRHGDFALVGVAAVVSLATDGAISSARLAFAGASDRAIRATATERELIGQRPDEATLAAAAERATADLDPGTDVHATASYRRKVAAVLARRALVRAASRATGAAS